MSEREPARWRAFAARTIAVALLAAGALGAAPASNNEPGHNVVAASMSFAPATQVRLANGAIVASQPSDDLPLVGAQIFVPAGLTQQPARKAGIASLVAAIVLQTPVEGTTTLAQAVTAAGGSIQYTLDPQDTRYYLEARDVDFARLLHELRAALARPDLSQLAAQRASAMSAAGALTANPLEAAYAMVRQVQYHGTGFASPDQGNANSLAGITRADVLAYVAQYSRGQGTIVALEGAVTPTIVDAARLEFETLPAGAAQAAPTASPVFGLHQVVAHRTTAAPWVAVGYDAPGQYSSDFATMLVIESLLGSGGDVHALNYASDQITPQDFVGAYYQYEADPGSMIVFLGGGDENLDQSVRALELGVARLRSDSLSNTLLDEAKKSALGDYFLSATRLDDLAWLLGRSAASPQGLAFENQVPQRIMAVSAADVQRVARRYLNKKTIAIVLPQQTGQ